MSFSNPEKTLASVGVASGMKVVDFGAGSGSYAFTLSRLVAPGGKVYAVDIQKTLLDKITAEARVRKLQNIKTVWGDVEKSGGSHFHEEELDCVVISNLLFQVEDREAVIKEAARVLRRGGRILVVDWTDSYRGMGPASDKVMSKEATAALLKQHDINVLAYIDAGSHHWGIVGEKRQAKFS